MGSGGDTAVNPCENPKCPCHVACPICGANPEHPCLERQPLSGPSNHRDRAYQHGCWHAGRRFEATRPDRSQKRL